MTDIKITFTPEDVAANPTMFTTTCSGAMGPSNIGYGSTMVKTQSVDASPDAAIRRIVAEELAKSEERIAEMVLRKLNERIRTQVGMQR